MRVFKGAKVSPGVAIGPVAKIDRGIAGLHRIVSDPYRERALYEAAIVLAKDELRRLQQRAQGPDADIFIFQIALLEDESFTNEIGDYIAAGAGSAAAVERAEQIFAARLNNVDNEYIRERSVDVRDACRRVVDILDGRPRQKLRLKTPSILAADLFFPSDILSVDRELILGLVSDAGSYTSHAAIMARTMGIPALCGLGDGAVDALADSLVVLDAQNGTLTLDPGPDALAQARHKMAVFSRRSKKRDALASKPCLTKDGTAFCLWAGCNSPEDVENAMAAGAGGSDIRSEMLLVQEMTEEQQYYQYVSCLAAAGGAPVMVRTYESPLRGQRAGVGREPALGLRGVRLLTAQRKLLDEQLCALLRAGTKGDLRVVLPMVGGPEDWDDAMREVERCKEQLRRRKVDFKEDLTFGCLVEVPAAALTADEILDHGAQFLAVDTNNLIQYTCAAGRGDARAARYYRAASPAVHKLVAMVQQAAKERRRPVYLCGLLAELPGSAEDYMRMGIRTFTMETACLPDVKAGLLEADLSVKR